MPALLAIIPHPDDESYSFGGTIALAAAAGWRCDVVSASSGELGEIEGRAADPLDVRRVREAELAASCRALCANPPTFWSLPDGALREFDETARVGSLLADRRPNLVLTLGSDGAYGHPDHIAVYRWVTSAWLTAAEPRPALLYTAFPRGLFLPQYQKCIDMLGDPPTPPRSAIGGDSFDYEVSIAGVTSQKLAAIRAHRSQLPGGDPESLFPPGIIRALLTTERFADAQGAPTKETTALLRTLPNS